MKVVMALCNLRMMVSFQSRPGPQIAIKMQKLICTPDDEDEYIEAPKSKSKSSAKSKGKAVAVTVSTSVKKATTAAKASTKRGNDRLAAGQRNAKEMDERSGLHNRAHWENEEYDPPSDLEDDDCENGDGDPNSGDWEDDTPSKSTTNLKKQPDVYIPPGMALTRNGQIVAANGRVKGRKLVLWHRGFSLPHL